MQKQFQCTLPAPVRQTPRCFTGIKNKQMPDGADRKTFVGPQTKKCPVSLDERTGTTGHLDRCFCSKHNDYRINRSPQKLLVHKFSCHALGRPTKQLVQIR